MIGVKQKLGMIDERSNSSAGLTSVFGMTMMILVDCFCTLSW